MIKPTKKNLHKALILLKQVSYGRFSVHMFAGSRNKAIRKEVVQLLLNRKSVSMRKTAVTEIVAMFFELVGVDKSKSLAAGYSEAAVWCAKRYIKFEKELCDDN